MKRILSAIAAFVLVVVLVACQPAGFAWYTLRWCETGGRPNDYALNTGNGFYGPYQFDKPTWRSVTGRSDTANLAPFWAQDWAAQKLYAQRGARPWPYCGPRAGL